MREKTRGSHGAIDLGQFNDLPKIVAFLQDLGWQVKGINLHRDDYDDGESWRGKNWWLDIECSPVQDNEEKKPAWKG